LSRKYFSVEIRGTGERDKVDSINEHDNVLLTALSPVKTRGNASRETALSSP
jgi:hypothetical protein